MDFEILFRAQRPALFTFAGTPRQLDKVFFEARDAVADGDESAYRLRGAKGRTLQGFFDEMGAVLQLPYYFGETWDALDDLLENDGYLPGTALFVSDAGQLFADEDPKELRNFAELMDRCNTFYLKPGYAAAETPGTGFHVVLQADEEALATFEERLKTIGAEFARIEA